MYLLGTFNKYKLTTFNALKTAHRYLVRKITGMFDRNNLFIDIDPHPYFQFQTDESVGIDYTGIQQLFEKGGLLPDVRSRWPYAFYDLLTVEGMMEKSKFRLRQVFDPH